MIRTRLAALTALVLLALLGVGMAPTPAFADDGEGAGAGTSTGITLSMDCYTQSASGTTIYLGYDNQTGSTQSVPEGSNNHLSTSHTGSLPTSFSPGIHHAVSSVTVSSPTGVSWYLLGHSVTFSSSVPACSGSGANLNAQGNGLLYPLGILVIGAVAGLVSVVRMRRFGEH